MNITLEKMNFGDLQSSLIFLYGSDVAARNLPFKRDETAYLEARRKEDASSLVVFNRLPHKIYVQNFDSELPTAESLEKLRRAAAAIQKMLSDEKVQRVALAGEGIIPEEMVAFLEGLHMANYRFDKYKTKKDTLLTDVAVDSLIVEPNVLEENLRLFEEMKSGVIEDGARVLRAKIDMASPNINMRDPIIYRVAHMTHHNTGDAWCIYPMYDFAHPIEDAIEHITHSICTLEFEDHRPLYDWVVRECGFEEPPRQIEFAKLYLKNVVTGKRYIKRLVEDGIVDGWDDPRLVSISGLRRRGYTPESIKMFVELAGVSKAQSVAELPMLEYCIREDLKLKKPRLMAILDPVKLVIDNYPE